jgi:hypothetical protein
MNAVPDPDRILAEFKGQSKTVSELSSSSGSDVAPTRACR